MNSFQRISCEQARQKLADGAVLIDIRDPNAYAAGHAPGAIRIGNDNLQPFLQNHDPQTPLLVMCYHGNSSQNAAQFFANQGVTQVFSVDGGFVAWAQQGPVESPLR